MSQPGPTVTLFEGLCLEKFHFFARKFLLFIDFKYFLVRTGYSLIGFHVIFPMQSSEFTKSLNFETPIQFERKWNASFLSEGAKHLRGGV